MEQEPPVSQDAVNNILQRERKTSGFGNHLVKTTILTIIVMLILIPIHKAIGMSTLSLILFVPVLGIIIFGLCAVMALEVVTAPEPLPGSKPTSSKPTTEPPTGLEKLRQEAVLNTARAKHQWLSSIDQDSSSESLMRWVSSILTNGLIAFVGWYFLDMCLYEPFGYHPQWVSLFNLIWFLFAGYLLWESFDGSTVTLNRLGYITIFGRARFHNIKSGLIALSFWKWIVELESVYAEVKFITIGDTEDQDKDAKAHKPFVRETQAGEITITGVVGVRVRDTQGYLLHDSKPPKDKFSPKVEFGVIQWILSRLYMYLTRPLRDINGNVVLDSEGNEIPEFLRARTMRSKTKAIADDLMSGVFLPQEESVAAKCQLMGVDLLSFELKTINSQDDRVTRALLDLELQEIQDDAEFLDTVNTAKKALYFYNHINLVGTPEEIPEAKKFSMEKCMLAVERREKVRQTIEFTGSNNARPFVAVKS